MIEFEEFANMAKQEFGITVVQNNKDTFFEELFDEFSVEYN